MNGWHLLDGRPLAPRVGPFPTRAFLEIADRHAAVAAQVIGNDEAAIALVEAGETLAFAGASHLTDYHSPVGENMDALVATVEDSFPGRALDLDSLPAEAAQPLADALRAAGRRARLEPDEDHCQVLDLEAVVGDWEQGLGRKQRHEVRRKRRRFAKARPAADIESGPEHFDAFVALHRASPGAKGGFMTPEMEALFLDLLEVPGARVDALHDGDRVVAAAFGFTDSAGYYLYNAAFDGSVADLSPGIVLVDRLVQRAVDDRVRRFDFLKGDEVYKRRLGAEPRTLHRLRVAA